jgi:ssDNA-specific exonuclease RecJ
MSFARNRNTLVQEIMEDVDLDELFTLPLSQEAFEEMVQLQEEVQNINTNADERDSWCQTWGKNFTSKKFYSLIYSMVDAHCCRKMCT